MFCSNCGTPAKEGQKFCENCGAPLEVPPFEQPEPEQNETVTAAPEQTSEAPETPEASEVPEASTEPQETPVEEAQSTKKSHKGMWIGIIAGVVLIAAVALLLILHPWNRTLSPEKMRLASEKAMEDVNSMHMDMTESISIGVGAESFGATMSLDLNVLLSMDIQKDPAVTRTEIGMSVMGMEQKMLMYTETVDGTVYSYTSQDNGATWESGTVESGNSSLTGDTVTSWTDSAEDLKYEGTETVDGVEVMLYSGQLSSEYLGSALNLGEENPLSMLGDLDAEDFLADLGSIPVTVGYDKATNRLVYIRMDATDVFRTLFERVMRSQMGELGLGVDLNYDVKSVVLEGRISKFNEIPPITVPEEAKTSAAGTDDAERIVGTWTVTAANAQGGEILVDTVLAFGENGTYTWSLMGTTFMSGSYEFRDGFLYLDDQKEMYSFSGDTLTITDASGDMTLVRN